MEPYQIFLLILLIVGITYILKKDYLKYHKLIFPIFVALKKVLKAIGNIFPNNKTITNIITIISAAIEAAGYAENLWLQGEIDKISRPLYAQQYIEILLERSNILITKNIQIIIEGVIAITCYIMPHYSI